jgi:hypothetical protein
VTKIILYVVAALVVTVGALTITGAGDDGSSTLTMTTLPLHVIVVIVIDDRRTITLTEDNSPVEDKPEVADRPEQAGSTAPEPSLPTLRGRSLAPRWHPTRETETERELDSAIRNALGR